MYCVRCKKHTETNDELNSKSKNGRNVKKGKCKECGTNKTCFVKGSGCGTTAKPKPEMGGAAAPTEGEETEDMEKYAKFSGATYIPKDERESWLKKEGIHNYSLDKDLSDIENSVFYNPETKHMVYGARGSVAAKDWLIDDAAIATGNKGLFEALPRYKSTKERLKQATEKYADYKHDATGHSLAGTLITTAGTELKVPFHAYSTGSSPAGWGHSVLERAKNIFKPSKKKWLKEHGKTYNVWTDPVSIADTIFPVYDSKHFNIKQQKQASHPHSILNFYKSTGSGAKALNKHCPMYC